MRGLRGLPLVLVLLVQDVLPRAEAAYLCSSNADCQYPSCNDRSCEIVHSRCNNGVWDAICSSAGSCVYNHWTWICPDPPTGGPPTPTTTTTPTPTTTTTPTPPPPPPPPPSTSTSTPTPTPPSCRREAVMDALLAADSPDLHMTMASDTCTNKESKILAAWYSEYQNQHECRNLWGPSFLKPNKC